MKRNLRLFCFVVFPALFALSSAVSAGPPTERQVLDAMHRATAFMDGTISCNGGYLWTYSDDLSLRWGEAPARESQIWVQGGTPDMGECFLRLYQVTGDGYYLECARKAANALIYGQHPLGGWHYFIDFDKTGLAEWYTYIFSNFKWGMEEYRHYYGNCTFDDDSTVGPTRFLLNLYMTTLDPAYRAPLVKALDFILMSQYPNGAWPQRYPLRHEFVHDGLPDYTSLYTFNDSVINGNIAMLVEAYERLGDERYLAAAKRGMDFLIMSQGPVGQAAWGAQHGKDLTPAWGRTHEPPVYKPRYTMENIRALERYYLITGDRRYLEPIPGALAWLEDSAVETLDDGRLQLSDRYEKVTNRALYLLRTDRVNEEGYGLWKLSYEPDASSRYVTVDIKRLRRDYERIASLSPEAAVAEYNAGRERTRATSNVDADTVAGLISSLDERGAWVEDVKVYGMDVTKRYPKGQKFNNYNPSVDDDHASIIIRGISTQSFIRNMTTFGNFLKGME